MGLAHTFLTRGVMSKVLFVPAVHLTLPYLEHYVSEETEILDDSQILGVLLEV